MAQTASSKTDIPSESWVEKYAPVSARPYLRLARMDRPIGTWLLLLPCWWSLILAAGPDEIFSAEVLMFSVLFVVGSLAMRGAGCTINDIVDRDFDGRVARTATRPIPSGDVSVRQAIIFLSMQLLIGLVVLFQFNEFTIWLAISSLGLVVIYPFAKRFTYWPQLVLGLTFNWGALLGWTAVRGQLDWPAVALYAAGVFWTLGYDTIYAHQDKEDDVLIGVKSSALKLGDSTRPWLFGFYGATIILIALAGYQAGLAPVFYAALVPCALHLIWQAWRVDIHNSADCLTKFKSNRDFGLLLCAAIILAKVV